MTVSKYNIDSLRQSMLAVHGSGSFNCCCHLFRLTGESRYPRNLPAMECWLLRELWTPAFAGVTIRRFDN